MSFERFPQFAGGCVLTLWVLGAAAQAPALPAPSSERDPTLPPAQAVATDVPGTDGGAPAPLQASSNVVVREGKPYLVVGSRLVAPGQQVDGSRLERITETEIWWRTAEGLQKTARYAGVQRRAACPPEGKPAEKAPKKKPTAPPTRDPERYDC